MRKFFALVFLILVITLSGCGNLANTQGVLISLNEPMEFENIASVVKPAIVGIGGECNGTDSVGSGVCVL